MPLPVPREVVGGAVAEARSGEGEGGAMAAPAPLRDGEAEALP